MPFLTTTGKMENRGILVCPLTLDMVLAASVFRTEPSRIFQACGVLLANTVLVSWQDISRGHASRLTASISALLKALTASDLEFAWPSHTFLTLEAPERKRSPWLVGLGVNLLSRLRVPRIDPFCETPAALDCYTVQGVHATVRESHVSTVLFGGAPRNRGVSLSRGDASADP